MGLDLSIEAQVVPLLVSLRRKSNFWSNVNLSLASQIIVANQVLLASLWYIASTIFCNRFVIDQIQRLIRTFIWNGKYIGTANSKVAWNTITLPT